MDCSWAGIQTPFSEEHPSNAFGATNEPLERNFGSDDLTDLLVTALAQSTKPGWRETVQNKTS
jgi:hypothetical protein